MKNNLEVFKPGPDKKFPHHTRSCVVCGRHFQRHEAICSFCACCQRCETRNPDAYGNHCIHCNNYIDQPRYDKTAVLQVVHHQPEHFIDTLEAKEPRQLQ